MSTTDLASSPRVRRPQRAYVRALVFTLIGFIACPQLARAQLLPPGTLGGLLDPVNNLLEPLDPLLGPILDPILDPLLGPGGLLNEQKLDAALRVWTRNGSSSDGARDRDDDAGADESRRRAGLTARRTA